MPPQPTIPILRLTDGADAPRQIDAAVDAAIRADRENPRLRIRIGGETLAMPTISALISALRRMREIGGAIELGAESDGVAAMIRLTGLDRVFALPLIPEERPTPRPRRTRLGKIAGGAAAAIALVMTLVHGTPQASAHESSAHETDPDVILARVIARNPDLSSFQSRVHVDVRLISFPFLSQHLDGSTYFKRPANYEVVFDRVPSYARGFSKLYSDGADPADWERRFFITYAGEAPFENRSDIVLRLVQRVRGMIDHETVLVDPNAWTIDQIRYDYYNGGEITMSQHFTVINGYTMLSRMDADIHIPHVHAVANGTYTDYRTNVAISDAVFTKKN